MDNNNNKKILAVVEISCFAFGLVLFGKFLQKRSEIYLWQYFHNTCSAPIKIRELHWRAIKVFCVWSLVFLKKIFSRGGSRIFLGGEGWKRGCQHIILTIFQKRILMKLKNMFLWAGGGRRGSRHPTKSANVLVNLFWVISSWHVNADVIVILLSVTYY